MLTKKVFFLLKSTSVTLCSINAVVSLWLILPGNPLPGSYPLLCMFPIALIGIGFMSELPIIFVVALLLVTIPLIILKYLKLASSFAIISGVLTIPLGILGILAGIILFKLSKERKHGG